MNKKLPYEEAFERQMNNLPSMHENESWQKMKKLLDDNDKRKPFIFLKNYKVWSTLILLLLSGLWLVLHPRNEKKEKPLSSRENNIVPQQKMRLNQSAKAKQQSATNPNTLGANNISVHRHNTNHLAQINSTSFSSIKNVQQKSPVIGGGEVNKAHIVSVLKKNKSNQNNITANKESVLPKPDLSDAKTGVSSSQKNPAKALSDLSKDNKADTSSNILTSQNQLSIQPKSALSQKNDSGKKIPDADLQTPSNSNKKYFLSAGIGVQQQVPVGGQKVVSYRYNGNSNPFSDYIPSIHFRLEKDLQWFLQAEFSYGAPQLVREFSYSRQTSANTLAASITTTTLRLKKTFYNEIPVSFNYYIRRNWSAGAGGVYSWFHGAIAEKEIMTNYVQGQPATVEKQIVPIAGYTDSFLYKSHTYLLLQTDYNWHRLSLGLRYTKDIQPFIKYTLPDGTTANQKNWSLEFILRFRILKSRKF